MYLRIQYIISVIKYFHLIVLMLGVDINQNGINVIVIFHVKQNIVAVFCQL